MDFSNASQRRQHANANASNSAAASAPAPSGPSTNNSSTSLSRLATTNVSGNIVTNVDRLNLDFAALCDDKTTHWDDEKKKCVASSAAPSESLCAHGTRAIATMCQRIEDDGSRRASSAERARALASHM